MVIIIKPTLEWYKDISLRYNLSPRCKYAIQRNCQKYINCKSLLNEVIHKKFNVKNINSITLYQFENQTNKEEDISEFKKIDNGFSFMNFCPESMYEKFDIFVTNLIIYNSSPDRTRATWSYYFKIFNGNKRTFFLAQHYTDCVVYSLLESDSVGKEKTNINLSSKQEKDYEKYGYICKDRIYIPGTPSVRRNCIILLNDKETKIKDANFLLLLRFVVELKKGKGGKVHINDLEKDKIIPSRSYYQYIDRLNNDLKVNIMFCKYNTKKLIKSVGARYFQISTHPDFITYNLDNLLNYPDDSRIRDLAKQLEKIEKNL